jgi:two-component system, sensor histidine kinase and response regulator
MNQLEQQTILIVDDMPNNLGILLEDLSERGFEILVAEDGESAIEQVEYARPDLILLDVLMPGIDGFETCRRLKANPLTQAIPVIFMTALAEVEDKIKGFNAGGVDYITKPIQQEEVFARIKTHLSLQNLQKQLQQQNEKLQQEICDRIAAEAVIKQLNENLKHRTIQLEAVNKELEAFSYSVSHDLRAYVRRISGFSQVLATDYEHKVGNFGKIYLQRVQSAATQMNQIIDNLLHLSYVTRNEMLFESVNLSEIAQQIITYLRQTAPDRNVEFAIADNLIVQGDGRLLKILLENLLDNAWKYTRNNPNARIELGILEQGNQEKTYSLSRGYSSLKTYFIRDNGVGFNMAEADKLFGTFVRLHSDKEFEGSGIGLATVQRIIHRHGGRIWAEAAVNRGATFYFTL